MQHDITDRSGGRCKTIVNIGGTEEVPRVTLKAEFTVRTPLIHLDQAAKQLPASTSRTPQRHTSHDRLRKSKVANVVRNIIGIITHGTNTDRGSVSVELAKISASVNSTASVFASCSTAGRSLE